MGSAVAVGEVPRAASHADGMAAASSDCSLSGLAARGVSSSCDGGGSSLGAVMRKALRHVLPGDLSSPVSSGGASPEKVTRVVFFDFDRTLTVVHVFKSLAGWVDQEVGMLGGLGAVSRPHAITERGQLSRACELGTAWIEQAFGGRARVCELRALLARLASAPGCRVILLTRGYIGVARKCLQELGMLEFFAEVYGNTGDAYGKRTKYDTAAQEADMPEEVACLLGDAAHSSWESKAVIMLGYREAWGLDRDGIIFIDDDAEEIWSVSHCVTTVHVRSPAGITATEVRELLRLVGGELVSTSASDPEKYSLQGWVALPDPLTCRPPPIMSFNRAHLPVLLARHLASLEEELGSCPNPMRRIKLLLREPLLLLSVAHREFVRQQLEGNAFTLRNMKPMLQCMQAQLGFREDQVEVADDDDDDVDKRRLIEHYECLRRADSDLSPSDDDDDDRQSTTESPHSDDPGISSRAMVRRVSNLYTGPAHTSSKQGSHADPAKMLCSAVATFQRSLLGLTPITLTFAGDRFALMGCHEAGELPSEVAIWSRYEKLDKLGAGHFGEVYQAKEVCSGKDVAVKTLEHLEHGDNGHQLGLNGLESCDRPADGHESNDFNEASVLKGLAHPNLVRMFEAVKTKEEVVIITELAPGGSLSVYAKGGRRGGAWIPGAMQQITSAVAYCHRRHVLHGDLKPENVLVGGSRPDNSPLCIVCDFGHTTICIGAQTPIAAPGDPRYIAPEVMAEEFLSPKSDVYMLGVTAYELLSGGWLPFFNQKAVTLHASYYQLKLGGVKDRILEGGLTWKDWDKIKTVAQEAKQCIQATLARFEIDRPTAIELLHSPWLGDACKPCKAAYDSMFGGRGWGLWSPQHPCFSDRLLRRAGRSWSYRTLCAFIGIGLDPDRIMRMRLLFRRMDTDGNGVITRKKFHVFAEQHVGLSASDVDALFDAADLYDEHFLDFKNLVMLCLDLDSFSDAELLKELRSVLSHLRGPVARKDGVPDGVYEPVVERGSGRVSDDPRVKRLLGDIWACLDDSEPEITAEVLLRLLRSDVL